MNTLVFLLVKSIVIFGVFGIVLLSLRRASAASRHLVCLLTLAALLAMPILSYALPGWQVLPSLTLSIPASLPQASYAGDQVPAQGNNSAVPNSLSARVSPSMTARPDINPPASLAAPQYSLPWGLIVVCLWAVGVIVALGRPILGLWGIRSLSVLSEPVKNAEMLTVYEECVDMLALSRHPELRQTDVPVPMTWSSLHPVIMLPANAEVWTEQRQRAVFLHEMAHVKRYDWLSHRLADLTCALYWFHPLVWITARKLRAEGEAACDDLVLASGVAAPEYARHLLEIARGLSPSVAVNSSAAAMAQKSDVSRRLTMILDKERSRHSVNGRDLLPVLVFAVAGLLALAVLRPVAQASAVNPVTASKPTSITIKTALSQPEYKRRLAIKRQFEADVKRYNELWVQTYNLMSRRQDKFTAKRLKILATERQDMALNASSVTIKHQGVVLHGSSMHLTTRLTSPAVPTHANERTDDEIAQADTSSVQICSVDRAANGAYIRSRREA